MERPGHVPGSQRLVALGLAGLATLLLVLTLAIWVGVDRLQVAESDYVPTYVAGTLIREHNRGAIYDQSAEGPLYRRLNPGYDLPKILPYISPPAAAALAAPLTLLDLPTAYRVWCALQLLMLAGAAALVVRVAPWPAGTSRSVRIVSGGIALAGVGTFEALLLGQWDGMLALGLAAAYACWRRGRLATGAALLGATAALTKPHLCLGLAAFVLAWHDRRVLLAALGGVASTVLAGTLVAGPGAWLGMLHATRWEATSADRPAADLLSLSGVGGVIGGQGGVGHALGYALGGLAIGAAYLVGRRARRHPERLESALGAALLLSLLAAPHLLPHDMALLTPVIAWTLARAAVRDAGSGRPWPGPWVCRALAVVTVLNGAVAVSLTRGRLIEPAVVVPPCLLVAAGLLWLDTRRRGARRPVGAMHSTG